MAQTGQNSPRWSIIGKKKGPWQVRHIKPYSDGNSRHWPGKPYRPSNEEKYLIQMGTEWAKHDGSYQPGMQYYIDKLPDGYALYEVDQPGGPQVYKRLFGHPSGRYYDSAVRFQVHFLWLMSGMQGLCECVHCGNPKPLTPRPRQMPLLSRALQSSAIQTAGSTRSSSADGRTAGGASGRPQRQIRSAGTAYAQDVEGTEDVYKELLKRLEAAQGSRKGIEDDIRELNSIDWRAEHFWDGFGADLIQRVLNTIELQHSFIPRVGELVLWCPHFLDGHYLMLDAKRGEYKFYSFEQRCFHGFPAWRAGVVAAVPTVTASDGPIDFPDIQTLPKKRNALNTSGFRIETFPDPNNAVDKRASKQYRYVPLRNIRPLTQWKALLNGLPQSKWHPSIYHALTCMTSISLVEKFWFNGVWPNASIRCKGIYIGAELITVGDTVRIAPETGSSAKRRNCTDVLVVESIRLNLHDIEPEHISPESPLLSSSSSITLMGTAYTLDIRRHYQMQGKYPDTSHTVLPSPIPPGEVKTVFRPVGSGDYGPWYHMHDPAKRFEVSYDQVLGRMYEAAAVEIWAGRLQHKYSGTGEGRVKPTLSYDLNAIEEARRFATRTDLRLEEAKDGEVRWLWADTRAEALDIATINGFEVGRYHDIRDKETLEAWRTQLRILNGHPITNDYFKFTSSLNLPVLQGGARVGRKPGSKVINGRVFAPGDPEYDEVVAAAPEVQVQSTPKHKTSQLAGAALVGTDDDDDDDDDDEGDDVFEDANEVVASVEEQGAYHNPVPQQSTQPRPKQPRTKQQIMSSAVAYISDDEEEWYTKPLPIRGGTEESEGGDYDPFRGE